MFTKINELLWTDQKFRELSDDGRLLFLYILTCPHRNIIGLYFLPIPYGSFDLNWVSERFSKGLHELLRKGFINYNFNTNIVFIKNFLKYNPLENPNQVKGAIKALDKVPLNGVDKELLEYLKQEEKPHFEPLIKVLNKLLDKPFQKGSKRVSKGLGKQVDVEVDVEVDVYVEVDEDEEVAGNETAASSESKTFKDVVNEFNNNIHPITHMEGEKLKAWTNDLDNEVIIRAIEEANGNNVRTINYINAILNSWHSKGIRDIQGVEAYLRDRANKKGGNNPENNRDDDKRDYGF